MPSIRRSRRAGMVLGASVASSRAKKRAVTQSPPSVDTATSNATDVEQLKQLAELKDQGILTQAEFDAKKKQILGL